MKIAANAKAYFGDARKDSFKLLNFSGYIANDTATVKTEINRTSRIKELFNANKAAKSPAEIKAENKASRIEFNPLLSFLIKVKNEIE